LGGPTPLPNWLPETRRLIPVLNSDWLKKEALTNNEIIVWRLPTWKKILLLGSCLLAVFLVAAILFPILVQADRYSGPGVITEALLLDANGTPVRNQEVHLYLRGHTRQRVALTNDKGQLFVDRKKIKADAITGFERYGMTMRTASNKRARPIFWQFTKDGKRPDHDKRPSELKILWPSDD